MKRKELLNGKTIPYDAPLPVLEEMLHDSQMQNYCLACEALSWRSDEESFRLLSKQLNDRDRWRRLYAFQVIYRSHYAASLVPYAVQQLLSDDIPFVKAALRNIEAYDLPCPEVAIKQTIEKYYDILYDEMKLLLCLETSEENYSYLVELFRREGACLKQEIVADVLLAQYEDLHPEELFALLADSRYAKQRAKAVRLAKRHGFDCTRLRTDPDGHVRKSCRETEK